MPADPPAGQRPAAVGRRPGLTGPQGHEQHRAPGQREARTTSQEAPEGGAGELARQEPGCRRWAGRALLPDPTPCG